MKIGIVGARDWPTLEAVAEYVDRLPADAVVVSGGARGVDKTAENAALARGLATEIFEPDLTGVRSRGEASQRYYDRNQRIVDASDELVAFATKETGGTADTVRRARVRGIPVTCVGVQIP